MIEVFFVAFLATFCLSGLTAVLSPFVLFSRSSFLSESLSHFLFLAVAFYVILPVEKTLIFALFALIFSSVYFPLMRSSAVQSDSLFVLMSQFGIATAILFSSFFNKKIDLHSFLFGDILSVTYADCVILLVLFVVNLIYFTVNYNNLTIFFINNDLLDKTQKYKTMLYYSFFIILSVSIAIVITIIGALLTTSFIVIPAIIARSLSSRVITMHIYAFCVSLLTVILAIILSYYLDLPTSPLSVVILFTGFILVKIFKDGDN